MCKLCNGTHVIHEFTSFGYRTSCCPVCGPEPEEIQNSRLDKLFACMNDTKYDIRRVF
jgi:hypothetical protein